MYLNITKKQILKDVIPEPATVFIEDSIELTELQNNVTDKDILISLNNDITSVRDKHDILTIINPKLKILFGTEDIFICFYEASSNTLEPILRVGEANRMKHPQYKTVVNSSFPIHNAFIGKVMKTREPLVFDIEELNNLPDPTPSMKLYKATGLVEALSISLINEGDFIGVMTLLSDKKNHFKPRHKKLAIDVANHISIIVTNIQANKAILKREKQNGVLLSFSTEIATVRHKNDLLHILTNKLKEFFPITGFGITLRNEDGNTHSPFVIDAQEKLTSDIDFKIVIGQKYSVQDGVFNCIMESAKPIVLEVDELSTMANAPAYVSFWKKTGLKKVLGISLRVSDNDFGCLILLLAPDCTHSLDDNLLQGVCSQISVAISNIRANDDIARREEEKSLLLSLSDEIASLRNRNDLFHVVNTKIKLLFSISECGIVYINEDRKTYSAFMFDVKDSTKSKNGFKELISNTYNVEDRIFSKIINADGPVRLDLDLINEADIPNYIIFWKHMGLHHVMGIPLRAGGKNIGCAFLHIDGRESINTRETLLKGVCAQLAVAVSNILANEDIANREEEKSILLSLSGEIAFLKNRNDLFRVVNARIKKLFGITQFGIAQINEDRITHSAFIMDLGDPVSSEIDFKAVTSLKYSISDTAFSSIVTSDEPVILDVDELCKQMDAPAYVKFWQVVGFKNLLCLALCVGGEPIGVIFFNIKPDEINNLKTNLLKGVCAQLAVAVSNIIAHEKLIEQLHEINKYKQQLEDEKIYLKEEIETSQNFSEIIGESREIKKIFKMIAQVAPSDSTVLLQGETGTGKELIARAIHNSSSRKSKLMVKVNCATLPANLIESELFGHERGSFTGAFERRIGKFELANNGTLFLDEIGDMPLDMQVKLLRALQEKEVERVGGKTTIKTDVRIIAATNRDLEKLMEEGKFRSDLFYRLNIFPITLPSLRNRQDDIPKLAYHFISRYSKKCGKEIKTISTKALQELVQYHWPGNIRELEHLIERSVLLSSGDTIKEIHMPHKKVKLSYALDSEGITIQTIDENEKEHILQILRHVRGRVGGVGGAAELLGVPTSTLNSRMKRLGIRKEHSA